MRYFKFILYIVIISISCKKELKLKITDLKFNEYEKIQISKNRIDTVFLIDKNGHLPDYCKNLISDFIIYDTFGNELISSFGCGFGSFRIESIYDSIGLLTEGYFLSDYLAHYKIRYHFDPDLLILYQYWSRRGVDTCFFHFDKSGRIIYAKEYNHYGSKGMLFETKYEYDSKGRLNRETVFNYPSVEEKLVATEVDAKLPTVLVTDYFYSDTLLDSVVTGYYFNGNKKPNHFSKKYFDESGLKVKSLTMDSNITYYQYKIRK